VGSDGAFMLTHSTGHILLSRFGPVDYTSPRIRIQIQALRNLMRRVRTVTLNAPSRGARPGRAPRRGACVASSLVLHAEGRTCEPMAGNIIKALNSSRETRRSVVLHCTCTTGRRN